MFRIQDLFKFTLKRIVFLSCFFTHLTFGQNGITKYDFPIEQSEIINCNVDSIEMLSVKNTDTFLDEVKKCTNIRVLILNQTSISNIPIYFENFDNLEKIILEDIKVAPKNIDYIPNLEILSLIRINDLKFPNTYFDSLSLKLVKIHSCKNIYINNINSDELFCINLDVTWNKNTKFQFHSKKLTLAAVNFILIDKWLKNPLLEEINIYSSVNVQITKSFFLKFPQLEILHLEL